MATQFSPSTSAIYFDSTSNASRHFGLCRTTSTFLIAEQDEAHLEAQLTRAEKLSRDPLQQVLIFIGLFQEEVEQLTEPGGGCLIASYIYQFEELDTDIRDISKQSFLLWRNRLGAKFEEVIARYPPRFPVNAWELADGMVSAFEGAFVMMRVLQEPTQLSQQLNHYRNYTELLFSVPESNKN